MSPQSGPGNEPNAIVALPLIERFPYCRFALIAYTVTCVPGTVAVVAAAVVCVPSLATTEILALGKPVPLIVTFVSVDTPYVWANPPPKPLHTLSQITTSVRVESP